MYHFYSSANLVSWLPKDNHVRFPDVFQFTPLNISDSLSGAISQIWHCSKFVASQLVFINIFIYIHRIFFPRSFNSFRTVLDVPLSHLPDAVSTSSPPSPTSSKPVMAPDPLFYTLRTLLSCHRLKPTGELALTLLTMVLWHTVLHLAHYRLLVSTCWTNCA